MSATPGKTKHYQTHVVGSGDIVLVDGPGLVIPDLRMTKPSMVLAGILPIDTLTDPLPCIDLMLQKVPFAYIQVRKTRVYGTEVASLLLTLRSWVRFLAFPKIDFDDAEIFLLGLVRGKWTEA